MSRVRVVADVLGLVSASNPGRFAKPRVHRDDVGVLVEPDEQPFSVPDGWRLVRFDVSYDDPFTDERVDALYAPVHPSMIEPLA